MAEINNSLAASVNSNPIDLSKTLGTISQIELAQAHAGLFGLQSQQEARKLYANKAIQEYGLTPEGITEFAKRGGDPAAIEMYQKGYGTGNALSQTGGLLPTDVNSLASANKNRAETVNTLQEATNKRMESAGRIGNMIISGASVDEVARQADAAGVPIPPEQLAKFRQDPTAFQAAGENLIAAGMKSQEFTQPINVSPTDAVTTRAGMMAHRAPVPSTKTVVGDKEGVQSGIYEPTPAEIAQGWVRPPPTSRTAQTFGNLPPALTPGQAKENESYGTELAKTLPVLADKADNSRQANFTLQQMKDESQSWDMGKGAPTLMAAAKYLKSAAATIGIKDSFLDKPIADYESFEKNAGVLTRQAVKEVSPRAAVQEFQMIQNQLPSSGMTRGGFNQIVNQFQAVNDYNIAKHQAGQAYRDSTGSMDGFDAQWNKNVTPSAFLVSRLPADQLGALKANLQRTPEGRSTLKSLTTQLKWAHDHNLDAMVQ